MSKTSIVIFWLFLLIPALLIGIFAFSLLRHEGERLERAAFTAAESRVASIIENMELAALDVQEGISENLEGIEAGNEVATLRDWERNNPLIRNVFVQDALGLVLYPSRDDPMTREEREFLVRFDGLLAGRVPWARPAAEAAQAAVATAAATPPASRRWQSRQGLKQLASGGLRQRRAASGPTQQAVSEYQAAENPVMLVDPVSTGWTPWFAENKLHFIGWAKRQSSGLLYGVELEMVSLYSRLISFIPDRAGPDEGFAILDDHGGVFYQASAFEITDAMQAFVKRPVGAALPHWQVAVYRAGGGATATAGLLTLLYALLIGLLVLCILFGGILLLRTAQRNLLDAQRKTSFVSNVSHELKTPLTTIRMYAELISEGRVKEDEKRTRYLNVIVDESRRLTRLVNNVLDFGRLEQERKNYRVEDIDLVQLVQNVVETQRMRAAEAGLEIDVETPGESLPIASDRDALEQVLLNLVDNGIKYAPGGRKLQVDMDRDGDLARIRIRDAGPGIPRQHREKIFEKFHRVDDSMTTTVQGSGLGLTIARRLVEDLGGTLIYEANPQGGACFTIRLPERAPERPPRASRRSEP